MASTPPVVTVSTDEPKVEPVPPRVSAEAPSILNALSVLAERLIRPVVEPLLSRKVSVAKTAAALILALF